MFNKVIVDDLSIRFMLESMIKIHELAILK